MVSRFIVFHYGPDSPPYCIRIWFIEVSVLPCIFEVIVIVVLPCRSIVHTEAKNFISFPSNHFAKSRGFRQKFHEQGRPQEFNRVRSDRIRSEACTQLYNDIIGD